MHPNCQKSSLFGCRLPPESGYIFMMPRANDPSDPASTNPSIFLRLNRGDTQLREIAWQDFRDRYAPVIARFARNFGCHPQDVDDVIQEVLTGFFAKSPTFVYDPSKGRFRSYLKTCTCNVMRDRAAKDARFRDLGLRRIDGESIQIEQTWNDMWEQVLLQRAVEAVRSEMGDGRTFRAFEQYVILDRDAQEVAAELGIHVDSVYRAKQQIAGAIRARLTALRAEGD